MNDMSGVIVPKSDQINAEDFIAGPATFTIEGVAISPGTEQPVSIRLAGENRVWRPCKSMSRVLVAAWGPDARAYTGRSVTLYRDPTVKWGGMEVGGIRISHLSNIERDIVMALTATKGKRAAFTVRVLQDVPRQQQGQQRQTPEQWVDSHLAEIAATPTLDALESVKQRASRALAKLKVDQPALHARAVEAMDARERELNPPSGRADDQHGDQFDGSDNPFGLPPANEAVTLESARAEIDACTNAPDVNSRVSALMPLFDDADAAELRGYGLERIDALNAQA